MAPEYRHGISSGDGSECSTAIDIWSAGCVIYELFTGHPPFGSDGERLQEYSRSHKFPSDELGTASLHSVALIKHLLEIQPNSRPTAEDALSYQWLQDDFTPIEPTHVFGWPVQSPLQGVGAYQDKQISRSESRTPSPTFGRSYRSIEHGLLSPMLPPRPEAKTSVSNDSTLASDRNLPPLPPRPRSSPSVPSAADDDGFRRAYLEARRREATPSTTRSSTRSPDRRDPLDDRSFHASAQPPPAPPFGASVLEKSVVSTLWHGNVDMEFSFLSAAEEPKPHCDECRKNRCFYKPNPRIPRMLYICADCVGNRALCEPCIRKINGNNVPDPHTALHRLSRWFQPWAFTLDNIIASGNAGTRSYGGLDPNFGTQWLRSDHSFSPCNRGLLTTLLFMDVPPGAYKISVRIRIAIVDEMVGNRRKAVLKTGLIFLGSLCIGAQALDRGQFCQAPGPSAGSSRFHLPPGFRRVDVKWADWREKEREENIELKSIVKIESGQVLEVAIRHSYETSIFKGSPFKWWLDKIM
jgi:Protein kinase domain